MVLNNIDLVGLLNNEDNNLLSNAFFNQISGLNLNNHFCNLLDESDFINHIKSKNSNSLTAMSLNLASLTSKWPHFTNFIDVLSMHKTKVPIFSLQEVWQIEPDSCSIDGYNFFCNIRENAARGGGVGIYVDSNFKAEKMSIRNEFIQNIFESVACKIQLPNGFKFIVSSIYRPNTHAFLNRSQQIEQFLAFFAQYLEKLNSYNLPVIILTDSNMDLHKLGSDNLIDQYADTFSAFNFKQIITNTTRYVPPSASCIDHILVNDLIPMSSCGILLDSFSDHFFPFVDFIIPGRSFDKQDKNTFFTRNFCEANRNRFKETLSNFSWNHVLNSNDTNEASNLFCEQFSDLYDIHFPIIEVRKNKNCHAINRFMTRGLLISRKNKLKLQKKAKTSPNGPAPEKFRLYRNIYNSLIKKAKKFFYRDEINNANGNSKRIWSTINHALNKPTEMSQVIDKIIYNGDTLNDPKSIADAFNLHFTNIGNNTANSVPIVEKDFKDYLTPQNSVGNSFFPPPIANIDLINVVIHLNKKKSRDINDMSIPLIQHVIEHISSPLTHIYNLSIEQGIFPENLKTSKVTPLYKKKGSSIDLNNYRGISIINVFSKIFEKLIANNLLNFLLKNNFFFDKQFGFLPHRSTNQAIIELINHLSDNLNHSQLSLVLCLDISKAFDSIPHDKLLIKLKHAGIRGIALNWFTSYLKDRKQCVKLGDILSDTYPLGEFGVLQGSILGVILFLIYINDLGHVSPSLFSVLFADDLNAVVKAPNLEELCTRGNTELNNLMEWYHSNTLAVNPSKSKALIVKSKYKDLDLPIIHNEPFLPIFINMAGLNMDYFEHRVPITLVPNSNETTVRILGVLFDEHINFEHHAYALKSKLNKGIYALNATKNIFEPEQLKQIFYAFFHSHLNYCSNIFNMLPKRVFDQLFLLQKKAIRLVCGAGYLAHTKPLFKSQNILPLKELVSYNASLFMYDYLNLRLPEVFDLTWKMRWQMNIEYELRNLYDFNIPFTRYVYLEEHVLYNFPRIWNNIPQEIKMIGSRSLFSKKLKEYLMSQINY